MTMSKPPVALITGAAKRIGAETSRHLHSAGFNVIIHYRHSSGPAEHLAAELNQLRANSAIAIAADLSNISAINTLAEQALAQWQTIDLLVNNASSFYPTPFGQVSENEWDDLLSSNLKAPFFLAQALAPALTQTQGCIINIADIYAERPLQQHSVYSIAKAGNVMLTKTLARELAPRVRVNGIAPGAILWPEDGAMSAANKTSMLAKIPLNQCGQAQDIARTILFLAQQAPYISGQIIAVDGGRSITI